MPSSRPITAPSPLPPPAFHDPAHHIKIFLGDCLDILAKIPPESVDLIFADPPYFLSNGGITCHAGRMVSVNKGAWDRSRGPDANHDFNRSWLAAAQRVLKPNGSLWVSGTSHVIHSVGFALQQLGFKLLNDITWVKPNPPPNLSCRYFTHATETLIWAARDKKSRHIFHYQAMKHLAAGKQMKSVWNDIRPPERWEKRFGKHPAQKPLALLERILLASSNPGDIVLDPFLGSGTSALAALRLSRSLIGIELLAEYAHLALARTCEFLIFALTNVQIFVDLTPASVDRSLVDDSLPIPADSDAAHPRHKLVRTERTYYFIGSTRRDVIFSTPASSLDHAWSLFRSSRLSAAPILFVLRTETSLFLTI